MIFMYLCPPNATMHESHQPLLGNDAVGAIKHSLGSPVATLDCLMGLLVEEEVIALLCDQTPDGGG